MMIPSKKSQEKELLQTLPEFIKILKTYTQNSIESESELMRLSGLFLRARQYDPAKALKLYAAHEEMRQKLRLDKVNPFDPGVRCELLSGKFTVVNSSDSTVAVFDAKKHSPANDHDILCSILYQIDAALTDEDVQRNGMYILYNMIGASYSNFDFDIAVSLLNIFTALYPIRVHRIIILSPPMWFRAIFRLSQFFLNESGLVQVELGDLGEHLAREQLPTELGGLIKHDHIGWIRTCLARMHDLDQMPKNYLTKPVSNPSFGGSYYMDAAVLPATVSLRRRATSTGLHDAGGPQKSCASEDSRSASVEEAEPGETSGQHPTRSYTLLSSRKRPTPTSHSLLRQQCASLATSANNGSSLPKMPAPTAAVCPAPLDCLGDGFAAADPASETRWDLDQFCNHVRKLGRSGLMAEFDALFRFAQVDGTTSLFGKNANAKLNRYRDVPCLDNSAVRLSDGQYIHANWAHGYKRLNTYILTQGPLNATIGHFWQMVWETRCPIVVMLTRCVESGRVKCSEYWPTNSSLYSRASSEGPVVVQAAPFCIQLESETTEQKGLFIKSILKISRSDEPDTPARTITHLLFLGWPDFDVPLDPAGFLHFLKYVNDLYGRLEQPDAGPQPIVIHCSAGIGRTGTYVTTDVNLKLIEHERKVDVRGTVQRLRQQRAGAVQMPKQYVFIHDMLMSQLTKATSE